MKPKASPDKLEAWTSRRPTRDQLEQTIAERRAIDARMHELLKEYHARLAEVLSRD